MLLLYTTNVQIFTEKRFLYNFVTTPKNRQVPCSLLMTELKKTVLSITTVATAGFVDSFNSYIVLIFLYLYKSLNVENVTRRKCRIPKK